jgi:nitroreductase
MDNLLELLRTRRSTRVFKETQISPELVEMMLKAALMSPSSKRVNPWQFIVVDDPASLKALSECKKAGAQLLAGTSLSVVVLADPDKSDVWIEDASIASIILQLEAEDLGLGSCWVQVRNRFTAEGEDSEVYVKRLLDIPEKMRVLSIIGIGVKVEPGKPFNEDKLQWEKIYLNRYGETE